MASVALCCDVCSLVPSPVVLCASTGGSSGPSDDLTLMLPGWLLIGLVYHLVDWVELSGYQIQVD